VSASTLARLAERAEDPAPFLIFLERRWSRRDLWLAAAAAAPGLADLPLENDRPIGLLLPNLPAAVVALLACWLAGRTAAPVDGRQSMASLHAWAETTAPAAIITLDLASVFERARAISDRSPPCPLIVMPMAAELSLLKRLISPWLRGGGTAKRPDGVPLVTWDALAAVATTDQASGELSVLLENGDSWQAAPEAPWPAGTTGLLACPLSEACALNALLTAWSGGSQLVLSPRLDARSLAKVRKTARPDVEVGAAAP